MSSPFATYQERGMLGRFVLASQALPADRAGVALDCVPVRFCCVTALILAPPVKNVREAYETIEQRAQNEGLPTMDVVPLARQLEVLNYGFLADTENSRNFTSGLPPRRPEDAFALTFAQCRSLSAWRRGTGQTSRTRERKGPDHFSRVQHGFWICGIPTRREGA